MRILVFGSTGEVGRWVVDEALGRGHAVTGVVTQPRKLARLPDDASGVVVDAMDGDAVAAAIADHDLVISALRPPDGREAELPALTKSVLDAAGTTRVLVVGGAANLLLPDARGHTVLSAPGFLPAPYRAIATASFAQYRACVASRADWAYFSPPASLTPGRRTGRFRRGVEFLLVDDAGESRISIEDFAVALLDEAERPTANQRRFTVAY